MSCVEPNLINTPFSEFACALIGMVHGPNSGFYILGGYEVEKGSKFVQSAIENSSIRSRVEAGIKQRGKAIATVLSNAGTNSNLSEHSKPSAQVSPHVDAAMREYRKMVADRKSKWHLKRKESKGLSLKEKKKRNSDRVKKWRRENPEKAKAIDKRGNDRKRSTVKGRLDSNFRSRIYQTLKSPPSKRGHKWEKILGYSSTDLIMHLESLFTDRMSWDRWSVHGWHIHHIVPLSMFDYETYEAISFRQCWALCNLKPFWCQENWEADKKIPIPEICTNPIYRAAMDCENTFCENCCFGPGDDEDKNSISKEIS